MGNSFCRFCHLPTSHDLGGGLPIKRLQVTGCLCCPNCMLTMLTQKFWFGYDDSEVWKCRSPGMSCWKKRCALRFKLSNAVSNMLGCEPLTINARQCFVFGFLPFWVVTCSSELVVQTAPTASVGHAMPMWIWRIKAKWGSGGQTMRLPNMLNSTIFSSKPCWQRHEWSQNYNIFCCWCLLTESHVACFWSSQINWLNR